jgi:Flp pilus assembly protein TadB
MIVALLCGATAGAGLWLVARGWYPPRPSLVQALAFLRAGPEPEHVVTTDAQSGGVAARFGRPVARALARGEPSRLLLGRRVRQDLAVVGRSPEVQVAEKSALALFGLLLVPAATALAALGGLQVPLVVPLWGSLVFAIVGFYVPDLGIHTEAQARRRDFRHALGAFLDLVVIALAGGGGVETALTDASSVGNGWAFGQLRHALDTARLARQPPWQALGRLGTDLGVPELSELAASVSLAGTEGAKVRASLGAKAASLRTHELAEAESAAQAATERMSVPVVVLFAGFLAFIGYPAIDHVLTGL